MDGTEGLCAWLGPVTQEEADSWEEWSDLPGQPPVIGGATPCLNSKPILQDSADGPVPTGLERCGDGRIHRVATAKCELAGLSKTTCADPYTSCDPACGPGQYCVATDFDDTTCGCRDVVTEEKDCDADEVLYCKDDDSRCVKADCHDDGDCDGGYLCALDVEAGCSSDKVPSVACESPKDTCRSDVDCLCFEDLYTPRLLCRLVGDAQMCVPNPYYFWAECAE